MYILIRDDENKITNTCLNHIIRFIKITYPIMLYAYRFDKMDKYLYKNIFTGSKKYTTIDVLRLSIRNLTFYRYDRIICIKINQNVSIPFYQNLNLYNVAKLIDKGNLDIDGTHIYNKMFTYMKVNFNKYYEQFMMGLI